MAKILVVDDDQGIRELLEIILAGEGHEVVGVQDAIRALNICRKKGFELIITDLKMPRMDGLEFIKAVKEILPDAMFILVTAFASGETALAAMNLGVYDYIEKGFDVEDFKKVVACALEKKGLNREELQFIRDVEENVSFGGMIGKNREMLKVYSTVRKVADNRANVLVLGESGTGKELVARAIHQHSPRKTKPFVVINCGGIPETLLESELFGHMKGAFTGANQDKPGLFEVASGGTIFLDEIGELSLTLQVKLLRVVEEKSFRRIAGTEDIKVDVRIISATNKDLLEKVGQGTFREDLYYRLNVIPIRIPPLRERKDDLPVLAEYFINKYARELGKEIKTISSYAMELLMEYPFPGNVRELAHIIERSIALESSKIILPDSMLLSASAFETKEKAAPEIAEEGLDLNDELARYERSLVEQALQKTRNSKTKAAQLLKISYDSLNYRIDKLGIK